MKLEDMDTKLLYTKEYIDYIEGLNYINPIKALDIKISGWPWGYDSPSVDEAKEYLICHPELEEESSPVHEMNISGDDV